MRVAAAVLAFALLSAAVAAPPDDLLLNGDFDAGTVGWTPGSVTEGVLVDWTPDGGRGGGGALHVRVEPGVRSRTFGWRAFIDRPPTDSALRISGWIRGKGVETHAAICAGTATTATDKKLSGDFDWTYVRTVLHVPPKTDRLAVTAFLVGAGEAWFDDLRVERTNELPAPSPLRGVAPGLSLTRGEFDVVAQINDAEPRMLVPMPMSYREQAPLTYELVATPPEALVRARIREDRPGNFLVDAKFRAMQRGETVHLAWRSLVLCGERSFADVTEKAPIPAKWPDDAAPWLRSTACVQSGDPRFVAIGKELREGTDDVREILRRVEKKAREIRGDETGRAATLDARTALDKQGSCTSCANLVAALLRSAGVPARVLAGTPLWSGPLQTHYVVEAFVPSYGWYLVESTMLTFPTQPYEQIEVCVVPPDYEDLSRQRPSVMGGVPYLSLDEHAGTGWWDVGTVDRSKNCGHVAELVRALPTKDAASDWTAALDAARTRWAAWLATAKLDANGRLATALQPDDVKATTAAELAKQLAR